MILLHSQICQLLFLTFKVTWIQENLKLLGKLIKEIEIVMYVNMKHYSLTVFTNWFLTIISS